VTISIDVAEVNISIDTKNIYFCTSIAIQGKFLFAKRKTTYVMCASSGIYGQLEAHGRYYIEPKLSVRA
jgi:hypothetical protein